MEFLYERSRDSGISQRERAALVFGEKLSGCTDAEFLSADKSSVFCVTGLPLYMPICLGLINDSDFYGFLSGIKGNLLLVFGENMHAFGDYGKVFMPENVKSTVINITDFLMRGVGIFDENGAHIIDLTGAHIGPHYDVNLLLGNNMGSENALISTPKSAVDSFGRGSFRADAGRQVLASRFDLVLEHNGEPANRQFYIFENGKQIFYSANADENVESAQCRHMPNRTEISYKTKCGLHINRTIFILPREADMPEAVEIQRVEVADRSGKTREIKLAFTGFFGLCSPESMMNDIVYASITHEGGALERDGKVFAVAPSSYPRHLSWQKRFAALFSDSEPMDEFCESYTDFIGNGTLEHPQNGAHLSSALSRRVVPFFAMAKKLSIPPCGSKTVDEFVGFTADRTPGLENFKRKVSNLFEKYKNSENVTQALRDVISFADEYSSYLKIASGDANFDAYVNRDLPFQVLYQSFVSRSFAWTQKAYREIGFREIQDMYASVYYLSASGYSQTAKGMLEFWVRNVYEMGYANHNFYDSGKEPGICSDDGLWLIPAVYRYVSITGDVEFLGKILPTADGGKSRPVYETMKAVITYSGKISVGEHGFPLMDRADWNDTMKLDNDWIQGPEKERLYKLQLDSKNQEYGVPLENNLSESVMNAFLLKIALDNLSELAKMLGNTGESAEFEEFGADLSERLDKFAWKKDFYARAMIGKNHTGYTFLGAMDDGLSADDSINGTYFLNSFSWSVLSGIADDEKISVMLGKVKKYLWTESGLKLCTPAALEKLASGTAAGHYYPGDRENGGVFKHAAMMAVTAMLKAAKTVKSASLRGELLDLAFKMTDKVLPFKAMENPFVLKGNPRFCTQYNNSDTSENCGPMLSGTASWLTLAVFEMAGIVYTGGKIGFSPVLPEEMKSFRFTVKNQGTLFDVSVEKPCGYFVADENTEMLFDGKNVDTDSLFALDGNEHKIKIVLGK